jgi:hypothetical protein
MRCRKLVLGLLAGVAMAVGGFAAVSQQPVATPAAFGTYKGPGGPPDPGPGG